LCKLFGEDGCFRKGKTPCKRPVSEANTYELEWLLLAAYGSKQADSQFNNSRSAQESAPSFGFKIYRY